MKFGSPELKVCLSCMCCPFRPRTKPQRLSKSKIEYSVSSNRLIAIEKTLLRKHDDRQTEAFKAVRSKGV